MVAALVVFLPKDVLKGPGGFLNLLGGCLPGFNDSVALYFPGDTGVSRNNWLAARSRRLSNYPTPGVYPFVAVLLVTNLNAALAN